MTVNEKIEAKAKELKSLWHGSPCLISGKRWIILAKHVLAGEIKARLEEVQKECFWNNILSFMSNKKNHINYLQQELDQIEGAG